MATETPTRRAADPGLITATDQLQDMVAPLRQLLEQGEKHVETLRARAREQEKENAKVRRTLSSIDPDYVHPATAAKKRRSRSGNPRNGSTGFSLSIELATRHANQVLKLGKDGAFFTQSDLKKEPWSDQGKASNAFKFFRHIEFIREAGVEAGRKQYAVLDKDAFSNWLAAREENSHG